MLTAPVNLQRYTTCNYHAKNQHIVLKSLTRHNGLDACHYDCQSGVRLLLGCNFGSFMR